MSTEQCRAALDRWNIDLEGVLELESVTPQTPECVFIAGSLIDGLGNSASDLDVFIVGNGRPAGHDTHRIGQAVVSVHAYGSRRVDFEYWPDRDAHALAAKLADLPLEHCGGNNVLLKERLSDAEIALIDRTRTGLAVFGDDVLVRLQQSFDYARLARYLMRVRLREIDNALEDLYGMADDSDVDVGLLRARDLLNSVCDAYLHFLGDTCARRKWRSKILRSRLDGPRAELVYERFWALQFPERSVRHDSESYRRYLEDCMAFANDVTEWIER